MEQPDLYNNDKLLKQLKEQLDAFRTPAPDALWDGIVLGIDEVQDTKIDEQLKEAAESFVKQAPSFLWASIESSLPEIDPLSADELLDEKLRQSYNKTTIAPETIWYAIEQNLNIDGIWVNMTPQLDKLRSSYLWRKRLKNLSIAAMLILLFRGCGFDFWPPNEGGMVYEDNTLVPQIQNYEPQNNPKEISKQNDNNVTNVINNNNSAVINNGAGETTKKEPQFNKFSYLSNNAKGKNIAAQFLSKKENNFGQKLKLVKAGQKISAKFLTHSKHIQNNLLLAKIATELALESLEPISPSAISLSPEDELVVLTLPEFNKQTRTPFKINYELGLTFMVHQGILINDLNSQAISSLTKSTVNSSAPLGYGYGLQIAVNVAARHTLMAELWFKSQIRQEYRYFDRGKTYIQYVDFNYLKLNLSYHATLLRYGAAKKNMLIGAVGVYLSNLQSVRFEYNAYPRKTAASPDVNTWDSGMLLSTGQKHYIGNHLSFEYGLRCEMGFGSIFSIPSRKNYLRTNLFGMGAYASLRYRF